MTSWSLIILQLAACIRRARNGPIEPGVSRESPEDNYYWHTREAVHEIARKHKVFYPNVLSAYQDTHWMDDKKVRELSAELWHEVQHPLLLVAEVMEA